MRQYLLGQLAEAREEEVELRLLTDPEYSQEFDLAVDEILDQYIAGEFAGDELERVRSHFFRSETRKEQLRFALALKERKSREEDDGRTGKVIPLPAGPSAPLAPSRRPWLTPYLKIAAVLVVAVGIGFIVFRMSRTPSDLDQGLVALNEAYRQERPVEARLSDLNYARRPNQRGETPSADYVKRDLAGSLLTKAASENPSAASHRALGQYYLTERKFDEAIDQFNQALALDPNDARTHINLGAALLEKGKQDISKPEGSRSVENFSRSLEHLNKGLQLDSSLLEGYFNRALVYQYMRPRDAEAAWREYLQKDPDSPWAKEARDNLEELERQKD